jgi:ApaG protein
MTDTNYQIKVSAQSVYIREQSQPNDERYLFAYTIVIKNTGAIAAQLRTRHWIITDTNGKVQEVRGDGVVGEQPRLAPGEEFTYTSAAVLETPVGSMHGSYQMIAEDGVEFDAEIQAFGLSIPDVLH